MLPLQEPAQSLAALRVLLLSTILVYGFCCFLITYDPAESAGTMPLRLS